MSGDMSSHRSFEDLVDEASSRSFEGWDFSWLRNRAPIVRALPWRYAEVVSEAAEYAERMLDMGTGGGEALLRIPRRAGKTIADEAYLPNVALAAANLRPYGIPVVRVEGAPDNDAQDGTRGRLPYADRVFDCVSNRHESFLAAEVFRVLRPRGRFVTQQVDLHSYDDLHRALGLEVPAQPESWMPLAVSQLRAAGLSVATAERGEEHQAFLDVGALIWYLRAVGWALPGFDLSEQEAGLRRVHAEMQHGPLVVRQRRFLVVASRA